MQVEVRTIYPVKYQNGVKKNFVSSLLVSASNTLTSAVYLFYLLSCENSGLRIGVGNSLLNGILKKKYLKYGETMSNAHEDIAFLQTDEDPVLAKKNGSGAL